ncbi:MAG TPA: hypothetical protein VK919_07610 [Solirubrobacterales bacterium]|nr:hypothetical protein [Solirubrobacterales bacterium]
MPASASSPRTPPDDPGSDLAGWREERLLRAGFDPDLAASIASDCAVDLHAIIELVERGCPPRLAARILAPLDDDRKPC